MFLIVQSSEQKITKIYGIFKEKDQAIQYLDQQKKTLEVLEYPALDYPFFLIEEFETAHYYQPMLKSELEIRIKSIKKNSDSSHYFNLWGIKTDMQNTKYAPYQILSGYDWHLHFTDHDVLQIENIGFKDYWKELLDELK